MKIPNREQIRQAVAFAKAFAEEKGIPLTRDRMAAQLGVSAAQLERWAKGLDGISTLGAELLTEALQESCAQVLEYCLRTDVRHEQLALQYLKNGDRGEASSLPRFVGEEAL